MSNSLVFVEESVSGNQERMLRGFRCRGCGRCCHLRIPVTHRDVARMTRATGRSAADLVEFVPQTSFRGDAAYLDWVWFGPRRHHRRVMCLHEVEGHCMYLSGENRCLAYTHRPTVCRTHPFVLEACERGERIARVELNQGCECAGDFDGRNHPEELLELHRSEDREDRSYKALVARWNRSRRPRSAAEFLGHLGLTV
jgi:Fe-S-cluster containining protein